MFLGCYDPGAQVLVYSNGGHLPPISFRGNVDPCLDTSGTVVGLFDAMMSIPKRHAFPCSRGHLRRLQRRCDRTRK